MWCWHKWKHWEEFEVTRPNINFELIYLSMLDKSVQKQSDYKEAWQKRSCVKCGLLQQKRV